MIIKTEILEQRFKEFINFIQSNGEGIFVSFDSCIYFDKEEKYKEDIFKVAKETITNSKWKQEDVGTGRIHQTIIDAIKTKGIYKHVSYDNNLINNWRLKDDFSKFKSTKEYEQLLFDFYKSKGVKNEIVFEELKKYGHPYNLIAYLFFIKDKNIFLPISQQRFDKTFELIGLPEFKTSGNSSWNNYSSFIDIIKQVRSFLKTKDDRTTLLDAHSFLWIISGQMNNPNFNSTNFSNPITEKTTPNIQIPQSEHQMINQNSFLFAWNPEKWKWEDLEKNIEELNEKGTTTLRWSCKSHKSIRIGDRAFLVRLGDAPRGIMASGYVVSNPFLSPHWELEEKDVPRVLIEFDVILNPNKEPILTLDLLKSGNLSRQHWTPQASGISIQTDCLEELEAAWFDFLTTQNIRVNPFAISTEIPEMFVEGNVSLYTQTRYERNPHARKLCLSHYGFSCSVCEFNFVSKYGKIGNNFIHVHHLTQVATIRKEYNIDPIKDLRPVCPNCHAMLHKQSPPLTIGELKSKMI